MPYRKPKRSYVLPVVATLAVAAPLATLTLGDSSDYRSANESDLAAISAQLAEVSLRSAPDIMLPLRELTGLELPELRLSDLRMLPLPTSIPIPQGLPLPPGIELPSEIPLPNLNSGQTAKPVPSGTNSESSAPAAASPAPDSPEQGARFISAEPDQLPPGTNPDAPALAPGALPPELENQVGAQVKELSRETPFSVVALTAADLANTKAMIRARQADGAWGPWYDTEAVGTHANDHVGPTGKTGTEPLYVGNTNAVQILVTRKPAVTAAPAIATDPDEPFEYEDATPQPEDPAQLSTPDLTAVLIDPGRGAIDGALSEVAAALPGGGPPVITRAQWGADEGIRCEEPTYDDADGLGGVTVHHTAGRNDYSQEESAGIVRAIYTYHAKTLGWCDIGYNALVDKYGQIFEGRFGGLDRPVQGAHAGGFNENTAGVALMGNHESEPPTDAAIDSVGTFIGWRTKLAHLDPKGSTVMYSEGSDFTPFPLGAPVSLPIIFAHRDVGNTSCPGNLAYDMMDRIRDVAASTQGAVTAPSGAENAPSGADKQTMQEEQQQQQLPAPSQGGTDLDLDALANLTTKLLEMVDTNVLAKHWAAQGGPNGALGAARSEPLPAAQGQQYAKFANGYIYTTPDGRVLKVAGQILDRFLSLGADMGILGLPLSNSYPVQNGQRSDFQYGSLILNKLTGIVTTLWKTYDNHQQKKTQAGPRAGQSTRPPANVPAPPATIPAPGDQAAAPPAVVPVPEGAAPAEVIPAPEAAAPPETMLDESAAPAEVIPAPEPVIPEAMFDESAEVVPAPEEEAVTPAVEPIPEG